MSFAENLKAELKKRRFTQKDFAEKCGLSQTSINKYLQGICEPDCYNLKLIANVLNISMDELCDNKPKMVKAKVGDIVIDRTYNMKGHLGVVVENREYQPVLLCHNLGLLGNEIGLSYGSWGTIEIIGHINIENVWEQALEVYERKKL